MPQSPSVFGEHSSNMSPGPLAHLKSPAAARSRSVSDSSVPRRGGLPSLPKELFTGFWTDLWPVMQSTKEGTPSQSVIVITEGDATEILYNVFY